MTGPTREAVETIEWIDEELATLDKSKAEGLADEWAARDMTWQQENDRARHALQVARAALTVPVAGEARTPGMTWRETLRQWRKLWETPLSDDLTLTGAQAHALCDDLGMKQRAEELAANQRLLDGYRISAPRPVGGTGDWPEDFSHENGNYQSHCTVCAEVFRGHKRRGICRRCALTSSGGGGTAQVSYDEAKALPQLAVLAGPDGPFPQASGLSHLVGLLCNRAFMRTFDATREDILTVVRRHWHRYATDEQQAQAGMTDALFALTTLVPSPREAEDSRDAQLWRWFRDRAWVGTNDEGQVALAAEVGEPAEVLCFTSAEVALFENDCPDEEAMPALCQRIAEWHADIALSGARVPGAGGPTQLCPGEDARDNAAPVAGSEPVAWRYRVKTGKKPHPEDGVEFASNPAYIEQYKRDIYDVTPLYASPAPTAASGAEMPQVTAEDVALARRGVIASEDWQGPQRECPKFDEAMARQKRILALCEYALAKQPPSAGPEGEDNE